MKSGTSLANHALVLILRYVIAVRPMLDLQLSDRACEKEGCHTDLIAVAVLLPGSCFRALGQF